MAERSITSIAELDSFFAIEPAPIKEIGFPVRPYNHAYDETAGLANTGLATLAREKARLEPSGEPMTIDTIFESNCADFDNGVDSWFGDRFRLSDER